MDQPGIVSTRPRDYHDALASTSGVAFSNGTVWKENRKMFLSTLNRMGMGDKNKMDLIIEEEVADFCTILKAKLHDVKTELQVSGYQIDKPFDKYLYLLFEFSDLSTIWASCILCPLETDIWYCDEANGQKECLLDQLRTKVCVICQ